MQIASLFTSLNKVQISWLQWNEGLLDSCRLSGITPQLRTAAFWQLIKLLKITSVSALWMQWLLVYEGRVAIKVLLTYVIFRALSWRKINKVQSSLLAEALKTGMHLREMRFQRLLISACKNFHMYWIAVLFYKRFFLSLLPEHFRKLGNAVCIYSRNSLFELHPQSSMDCCECNKQRQSSQNPSQSSLIPEVSNSNVSSKSHDTLLLHWLFLLSHDISSTNLLKLAFALKK